MLIKQLSELKISILYFYILLADHNVKLNRASVYSRVSYIVMGPGVDPPNLANNMEIENDNSSGSSNVIDPNKEVKILDYTKRNRDSDSENEHSDYEAKDKERIKKSKTIKENLQLKSSFSILRPSILNTNSLRHIG